MLKVISFPFSGFMVLNHGIKEALGLELIHQLTHDEDLNEPINPDDKHIVIIRGFELAINEWYASGDFEQFRESKSAYYDGFLEKWVNTTEVPNRLTITYLDLVDNTMNTILKAYRFITGAQIPDNDLERLRIWTDGKSRLEGLKRAKVDNNPLSLVNEGHTVD